MPESTLTALRQSQHLLQWTDIDFENSVIYLYRSKVSNDDLIPMTHRLRLTLLNRRRAVEVLRGGMFFPAGLAVTKQ